MTDERLGLPDEPNRRVLFALELIDPITRTLVRSGFAVKAAGLQGLPIVSRSGRLVWFREGDAWPGAIRVTPGQAPFAEQVIPAPPRPADLDKATPEERLVRITLRPTRTYRLADGITAVRGRLRESGDEDARPIAGARVQLAWRDANTGRWSPRKPEPETVDPDGDGAPSPSEVETDRDGEFIVFLHLNPPKPAQPDVKNAMLAVRLQFTQGRSDPVTRATPNDFPFLADGAAAMPKGRIPEGQVLARDLTLGWSDLQVI